MTALAYMPAVVGIGIGFACRRPLGDAIAWARNVLASDRQRDDFHAIDATTLDWTQNRHGHESVTYFMKRLFEEPASRYRVLLVRYPAGQINPPHRHTVGHGMYVLEGTLVCHRGSFGPNTFVWFPAEDAMWHGAGSDGDLVVLFVTGRHGATHYLAEETAGFDAGR